MSADNNTTIGAGDEGSIADLMALGEHCSFPGCNRLDFLPFTCDKCQRVYCLEHRSVSHHNCVNSSMGDTKIPTCPLCGQSVKIVHGQSANDQIEQHISSGCKNLLFVPQRRKTRSNKCSSCGHHELIPLVCQHCSLNYCIRHRHAVNHNCRQSSAVVAVH